MASYRIVARRYEYLRKIEKLRAEGYLIIYLDETCFDSNETVRKLWADLTKYCSVSAPVSRGKRVVICHAGSKEGFVPNSLLLCGKDFAKSYADYHEDMNGAVFENWYLSIPFSQIYQKAEKLQCCSTTQNTKAGLWKDPLP